MILFEILNIIGYWKDKNRPKLDISRIYDAFHTGYAINNEIFVTNDQKTKMKALAVYNYFKVKTKVVSPDEAPDIITKVLFEKNNLKYNE